MKIKIVDRQTMKLYASYDVPAKQTITFKWMHEVSEKLYKRFNRKAFSVRLEL